MSKKGGAPRTIPATSNHYVPDEKLKIVAKYSNRGLAIILFVLLAALSYALFKVPDFLDQLLKQTYCPKKTIHALSYVYFGALFAISFFEAPTKFRATQASRASLLDVGRLVFHRFGRIELFVSFYMAFINNVQIIEFLAQDNNEYFFYIRLAPSIVFIINFIQAIFLQPALDHSARNIIADKATELTAFHRLQHQIYVLLEFVKAALLILSAFFTIDADTHVYVHNPKL